MIQNPIRLQYPNLNKSFFNYLFVLKLKNKLYFFRNVFSTIGNLFPLLKFDCKRNQNKFLIKLTFNV